MANKDKVKTMIVNDMLNICNHCTEVKELINENLKDTIEYLNALLTQIPQSTFGPLIAKTPKPLRKKGAQRIETIPEDDIVDCTLSTSVATSIKGKSKDNAENTTNGNIMEVTVGRTKREASKKAADSIKRQQSMTLNTKLRRPLSPEEDNTIKKEIRETRSKRKKSNKSSSDEESSQGPRKHSKLEENVLRENTAKKTEDTNLQNNISTNDTTTLQDKNYKNETLRKSSTIMWHSSRKRTLSQNHNLSNKESKTINDTVVAPRAEVMDEPSMYEDAIEKPIPIMNSTMNLNSTITMQKMMNATVVLEPLSAIKLNETVTITKNIGSILEKNNQQKTTNRSISESKSSRTFKLSSPSSKALQDRMHPLKEVAEDKEFNYLITDDESSPEIKKSKPNVRHEGRKRQRPVVRSVSSSEDEILNTPAKPTLKEVNTTTVLQEVKATYKPNALFSPYAKESVKKRVEAFEQAGLNSPKVAVEIDVPTRLTRTKTRAIAAAQAETSESTKTMEKTVVQKLARKSLAKAKKISLAKYAKDTDECKENKMLSALKISRIVAPAEKVNQKHLQKTTPLGKTKIQLPLSVNRIANTPANSQISGNHTNKALSATRSNIITSVDSFIHSVKSVNKRNSIDKIEEKKRKMNDEDARKKREEALRLRTEEKRRKRQEKELKNKLAREAKEKQELEKRHKAEKEREEKARLAQQMQEKQREEIERKRLIQMQRAQEKEERRRQEEQQRLQRLQEQEEAERLLAEQRRREQEAEKRKEAEARAQQQAAAEALRAKNQVLIAQAKYASKHNQGPTNYILDSEPDEDESDDETRPKHVIPYWAQPHIRKTQLAMQRYIPDKAVSRFFDTKKCTPDLSELFQGISTNRLKRTSSAIWKTPPRYSMMETE